MTRTLCLGCAVCVLFSSLLFAQSGTASNPQKSTAQQPKQSGIAQSQTGTTATDTQTPDEQNPPEEDESVAPKTYTLNPLESERNVKVGNFYWHRGKYRAAAERYRDATRYNPSSAEAFFKLGEAEEKLKNKDAARVAFQRVLAISPDSKLAQEAKKKLAAKS